MKLHKMLGLAVVAAMALTAVTASSASATTLEKGGVAKNEAVAYSATITVGNSSIIARTDGSLVIHCGNSSISGITSSFTGTSVTGSLSTLSFETCERPVTVHKAGTLHIEHRAGTTDGTVSSSGAEWTVGSPFGTLNCKSGTGVDIGTLTGTGSGLAHIDVNAVLNCGFLVPSASWKGTYTVTSPSGLGVSA